MFNHILKFAREAVFTHWPPKIFADLLTTQTITISRGALIFGSDYYLVKHKNLINLHLGLRSSTGLKISTEIGESPLYVFL